MIQDQQYRVPQVIPSTITSEKSSHYAAHNHHLQTQQKHQNFRYSTITNQLLRATPIMMPISMQNDDYDTVSREAFNKMNTLSKHQKHLLFQSQQQIQHINLMASNQSENRLSIESIGIIYKINVFFKHAL